MEKYNFYNNPKKNKELALETINSSWGFCAKASFIFCLLNTIVIAGVICLAIFLNMWYVTVAAALIGAYFLTIFHFGWEKFIVNYTNKLKAGYSDLFAGFGKQSFKLFLLMIKKLFSIILMLILFIVPGVRLWLKWNFAGYVLSENENMSAGDICRVSSRLTKNNLKRICKLYFSFTAWFLLCLVTAGIALIWILPYFSITRVIMYNDFKTDY